MINTKSVYDPVEITDGKRVLVTRYWPRGISKKQLNIVDWIRELAPSKELLNDWKNNNINWQKYELRYFKEVENKQQCIQKLANLAVSGTITLLCFEKEDNPHCHRHLLNNLLKNLITSDIKCTHEKD
ncbi:MAG: DUF488 family protein [Candidatus Latescibacteria bacterium]|nr:DUF488 family protein [Candidatus Latescibacterota bacterium]